MGSEMGSVDLSHIASVTHRDFKGTRHGFDTGDTALFIDSVTADIAREADKEDFVKRYIAHHKSDPVDSACSWSPPAASGICTDKIQVGSRGLHSNTVVPKHFWVDHEYVTWGDAGKMPALLVLCIKMSSTWLQEWKACLLPPLCCEGSLC